MRLTNFAVFVFAITILLLANIAAVAGTLEVPFESDRHRIIIPTTVNGSKPLNVILDTGMRFDGVYLFHKELADQIDTAASMEVRVPGAGAGEASTAIMMETETIGFGDITVDSQRVIIALSQHTQSFPTDGVIGWNLFGHYIVEINYDDQVILLHDSTFVPADTNWTTIPIELKKNLPWLEISAEVVAGETVTLSVYVDLASGDVLELLTGPNQKFTMPQNLKSNYLGSGLSGDIQGQTGRIPRITLAGHVLSDVPTAFAMSAIRSKQEGADGILGNGCIERFNVIFDYYRGRMYLKPNASFSTGFEERGTR